MDDERSITEFRTAGEIELRREDNEYATMLAPFLLNVIEMDKATKVLSEMTIPIFIGDVQSDLIAFVRCRRALQNLGIDSYPCQLFGDSRVPLDWLQVAGEIYALYPKDFTRLQEPWYRIESFRSVWGHQVEEVPWQTARGILKTALHPLIAIRNAVRNVIVGPRCGDRVDLTVETNTPGLEIRSTITAVVRWRQVGFPSPVQNCIAAGDYRFQARAYEGGGFREKYTDDAPRGIYTSPRTEVLPV
jgi:hypothetical protein